MTEDRLKAIENDLAGFWKKFHSGGSVIAWEETDVVQRHEAALVHEIRFLHAELATLRLYLDPANEKAKKADDLQAQIIRLDRDLKLGYESLWKEVNYAAEMKLKAAKLEAENKDLKAQVDAFRRANDQFAAENERLEAEDDPGRITASQLDYPIAALLDHELGNTDRIANAVAILVRLQCEAERGDG